VASLHLATTVLSRGDQLPDELFDVLVPIVGVEAVEEGEADGILNVCVGPALAEPRVAEHLLPSAPPKGHHRLLQPEQIRLAPAAVLNVSLCLHVVIVVSVPHASTSSVSS